jgi:hypothetical protein
MKVYFVEMSVKLRWRKTRNPQRSYGTGTAYKSPLERPKRKCKGGIMNDKEMDYVDIRRFLVFGFGINIEIGC